MKFAILRIVYLSAYLARAGHGRRGQTASAHARHFARYSAVRPFAEAEHLEEVASATRRVRSMRACLAFLLSSEPEAAFVRATAKYATPPSPLMARRRISVATASECDGADPDELELKKLQAERLALKAKMAELEAERLSLEARELKSESPGKGEPVSAVSAIIQEPSREASVVESPIPQTSLGTSLEQLCDFIDVAGTQAGLKSVEQLKQIVSKAWDAARVTQRTEIDKLRKRLDLAAEIRNASKSEGQRSIGEKLTAEATKMEEQMRSQMDQILVPQLVEMSENRSGSLVERRARARALTRAAFKWLAVQAAPDDADEEEEKVPVPGEGLVSRGSGLVRLRLLEQHERAECVEYRFFARALSDDDMFEEAAGTSNVVTAAQANILLNLIANWFTGQELMGNTDLLKDAERDLGPGFLMELEQELAEAEDSNMTTWLKPLSDLLRTSSDIQSSMEIDFEKIIGDEDFAFKQVTLFPLLLGYCSFTQGNFEPLVVYYFSRILARFNAQEIARYEGRDVASMTDTWVAQREAEILIEPTRDSLQFFFNGLIFATVVQFGLFAAAAYFLITGLTEAFTPLPVDPLAF